jgi:predicted O-methyltransferase YrrM
MDPHAIRAKFGMDYVASEQTFSMGIDRRFAATMAERCRNRLVLETCTGGGFTTIELARVAAHVITVEIDPAHQEQAKQNLATAGSLDKVTFVLGDILLEDTWEALPGIDAALWTRIGL